MEVVQKTLERIVDENPNLSRQEQLITAWKSVPIWGPPGTKLPWPDDDTHEEPTGDSLAEPEFVESEDSEEEAPQASLDGFEHEPTIDDLPEPSPRMGGVLVKLPYAQKDLLERYGKATGQTIRQVTAVAIYYYIDKVVEPFLGEDN